MNELVPGRDSVDRPASSSMPPRMGVTFAMPP